MGWNKRNMTAKKWLKTMINRIQKSNYQTSFSRWKGFNDGETTMQLITEVHSLKVQKEELKNEDGLRADKLNRAMDKSARVSNSFNQNC